MIKNFAMKFFSHVSLKRVNFFLMPKNSNSYRIANAVNYAVKRALGTTVALAAGQGTRKAFSKWGSKTKSSTRKTRRTRRMMRNKKSSYNSITMTKRRKTVRQNHSNENRAVSLQVGARNPTAYKLASCAMEPQWYRIQGLSQYDTTSGFYPIANRRETVGANWLILPAHVWDLTCSINWNGTTTMFPSVGHALCYDGVTAAANATSIVLNSQNFDGTKRTGICDLLAENVSGGLDDQPKRKCFHHWSHIKMNLYGVRKRATRFVCQLVMVKEDYADFLSAASTNVEKKKLWDYLTRPFMYNNLNSGDPQTKADIKILKTYEVIVAPTTTDEYGGQTATPHMQTVNWFINHNRIRRYDWKKDVPAPHGQDAAFDVELAAGHDVRTEPKTRVYLLIRALSPDRRDINAINNEVDPDPISEPSYDLVIRQKFSNPT